MTFVKNDLTLSNDLWTGSNTFETHVLGTINEHEYDSRHSHSDPRKYFGNFIFLGPHYRTSTKHISQKHQCSNATESEHWTEAFMIDPNDHELVVDTLAYLKNKSPGSGIFKLNMSFSLTQVDTMTAEYAEIRKWNALNKLSDEEIKLLGLEKEMVYLKLKYSDGETRKKDTFF